MRSYWVADSKLKAVFGELLNERQGPSKAGDWRQVNVRYTMHDVMVEYVEYSQRRVLLLVFDGISRGTRV